MKKLLPIIWIIIVLLPSFTLAEEIHLLWDIPFPQSATQFAKDVERVTGIKMETTPLKVLYPGSIEKLETAAPAPGQVFQLFGVPCDLKYSHYRWNSEERGGVDISTGERIVIDFIPATSSLLGKEFSAPKAYAIGVAQSQSIWNGLVEEYGDPSSASITYENDDSEWWDGQAAYVKEVSVLSPQAIQTLLEDPSAFVINARNEYPYPGIGRSILVNLYFGNIDSSASYATYSDSSFGYRNKLVYATTVYDVPQSSLEQREQKQS